MKTILTLAACSIGAMMISSCGGDPEPPTEVHNITVVKPKPVKKYYTPKPKPRPVDRAEDFRATTTPN